MTARAVAAILLAGTALAQSNAELLATLRTSRDGDALEKAAVAVVRSKDSRAVNELGELLGDPAFLSRLDDTATPSRKFLHIRRVFAAMEAAPSAATEAVSLKLARDPEFSAEGLRLNFLLAALAAVRPVSERAATLFLETSKQGYLPVSAPLLVANGSPRALDVFEKMISDGEVDEERRADVVRRSVIPYRTSVPVLRTAERLLDGKPGTAVRIALLEALFTYEPRRWFGPERTPPTPPAWESASKEARAILARIAQKEQRRSDVPGELRRAIRDTAQRMPGSAAK